MASLTNPNPIDNTSPNRGADLGANFDICKSNDDALNAELGTKANSSSLSALETTVDQRTEIQTGTGHAPTGTPVKMSWFEGAVDSNGDSQINHGLGSNVLGFSAYVFDSIAGFWIEIFTNTGSSIQLKYYNNTICRIKISVTGAPPSVSRFLVWYK